MNFDHTLGMKIDFPGYVDVPPLRERRVGGNT